MAEDRIIITDLNPASYQAMISGRFNDALEMLLRDPEELPRFLKVLDNAVSENKSHALEIKDRNFFKRMLASNTTDLANVAYEQNVVMSAFYLILLLQNTKTEASQKLLAQLYNYADNEAKTTGKEQNNIQRLILDVLNKNAYDHYLDEVRDKALMKLLRSAEYQHQFEDEMREEAKTARENYESAKVAIDAALQTLSTQINTFTKEVQKKQHLFEEEICKEVNKKQDGIEDLDSIRRGATLGATSIQEHQDISGKADVSFVEEQLQRTKENLSQEVTTLQQTLQKAQEDLQKEHQGYEKLKRALITASICTGTISIGALIALLILIL